MTPPARSRKGKKAWRKNISTNNVQDFIEQETYQERRGPAAHALKDDQLFFFDKTADEDDAKAVVSGGKRKRQSEPKPLRSQLILNEAHKAKPVPLPPPRKKSKAKQEDEHEVKALSKKTAQASKDEPFSLDIWGDEDLPSTSGRQQQQRQQRNSKHAGASPALAEFADPKAGHAALYVKQSDSKAKHKKARPASIAPGGAKVKAVEVDLPGCSYNPEHEAHQDALAVLVASEMKKVIAKEFEPLPPPLTVEGDGRPRDELSELLVEEEADDDDDEDQGGGGGGDVDADGPGSVTASKKRKEKKTAQERKKQQRAKEAQRALDEAKRMKAQRRDIDHLRLLQQQLQEEEQQRQLKLARKNAIKEEKAVSEPARLGKLKYEEPAVQVLTSDEVSGSLRKLKACPMLAADRFKSMQKRGVIEPRKPAPFKKGRRVVYEKDARRERAVEGQREVEAMRRKRVALEKQLAQEL